MAKKTEYFEHESLQDKDSIVSYLKALTKAIENGEVLISDDEDTLLLQPTEISSMSIRAKKSKHTQTLRFKFEWNLNNEEGTDNAPLFIKPKKGNKPKKNDAKK